MGSEAGFANTRILRVPSCSVTLAGLFVFHDKHDLRDANVRFEFTPFVNVLNQNADTRHILVTSKIDCLPILSFLVVFQADGFFIPVIIAAVISIINCHFLYPGVAGVLIQPFRDFPEAIRNRYAAGFLLTSDLLLGAYLFTRNEPLPHILYTTLLSIALMLLALGEKHRE